MNIHRDGGVITAVALLGGGLVAGLCGPVHAKSRAETESAFLSACLRQSFKPCADRGSRITAEQ
ncbi:MAG: hypothetical protein H6R26_2640 [Proteobacteria bacterium]|nr:hypothetical protein [Pseudomonadota bacterium]